MGGLQTGIASFPAHVNWSIDADENEEWSTEKFVEYGFGVDVGCHPAFAPSFGDKVQEVLGGIENVLVFVGAFILWNRSQR